MCVGLLAMTGARTPTTSVTSMMTMPTSAILRRVSCTSHRGRRRSADRATGRPKAWRAGSVTATDETSPVLHPGIDNQVREIDREVDEHVDAGDAQDDPLDHWVVAPEHRGDDQTPEARDVEDGLHDHRARQQDGEADADDRDRRDHRVLQCVLVDDG